jgi:hypothetical protein
VQRHVSQQFLPVALALSQRKETSPESRAPIPWYSVFPGTSNDDLGPGTQTGPDTGYSQDKVQLLRLWYHENCRVFRDRLVNEEDRSWFDELLEAQMEEFGVAFNKVCPFQPILYGDFMSPGSDVKSYELITSESKVSWCSTLVGVL